MTVSLPERSTTGREGAPERALGGGTAALTVADVAPRVRRGVGFVRKNAARMGARKVGRGWIFTEENLAAWLAAGEPTTDKALVRRMTELETNLAELQNAFLAQGRQLQQLKTENSKLKTAA